MVELDRCVGKCNTFDDLSDKVRVRNKTADLNPSFFSMITGINESKTLTKPISSKCKCRLDEIKCHSDQWWNNNKCTCECKKHLYLKEIIFVILLQVVLKMENI